MSTYYTVVAFAAFLGFHHVAQWFTDSAWSLVVGLGCSIAVVDGWRAINRYLVKLYGPHPGSPRPTEPPTDR